MKREYSIFRKRPIWTAAEDAVLRKHYRDLGCAIIAERFGRTVDAVYIRAGVLKVTNRGDPNSRMACYMRRKRAEAKRQHQEQALP